MRIRPTAGAATAAALVSWAVAAAAGPPGELANIPPARSAPLDIAPMDVTGELDSVWIYLSTRYDRDGDGRITAEEYQREGGRFDRVDRDGDGAITPADFERSRGGMTRGMATTALMFVYFQDDDDAGRLSLEEMRRAIAIYDTSRDGVVDQEEFACAAEPRKAEVVGMGRMLDRMDPWPTLLDGADADGDGRLAAGELVASFERQDDGDGVLNMRRPARRQRGGARGNARGGDRPISGPAFGTVAPDFALQPPEGGETVTLSAYAGQKAVALIFGSYT
jgi:Ca2+-binding EF-hand superfamily protein